MKFSIFLCLFSPFLLFAQKNTENVGREMLATIPFANGQVIYEKVFLLDSVNDKNKVFTSAKAALIKNANYKYTKIDEDRVSGNLSSEIFFQFNAKPGVMELTFNAKGLLSIDVKENRFRVRIMNNQANIVFSGVPVHYTMPSSFELEMGLVKKNKWKVSKSVLIPWDASLRLILEAFGILISQNVSDDF